MSEGGSHFAFLSNQHKETLTIKKTHQNITHVQVWFHQLKIFYEEGRFVSFSHRILC